MNKPSFSAFTLVELIVVITIIAILWTVGFVSYSNYLAGARDSNRTSQMVKISDALQVYATTKTLPLPDNKVDITASGTIIAYQGNLGSQVMQAIDYNDGGLDPKDKQPFTYIVGKDRKSLQLLALMEESRAVSTFLTATYAADYKNRYPKVYGSKLWVLTDTSNTPIQELNLTGSTLDILTTTLKLKSFLSDNEYVTDNLATLPQLQELVPQRGKFWKVINNKFVYTAPTRYPWCDADDIIVGNYDYRVAACNVGTTVSGTGAESYGRLFQWGENIAWDANTWSTSANNCTWERDTQSCTSPSLSVWPSVVSDMTIGWVDRWFDYGDTRGPCAPGYRVPSWLDWQAIITKWGLGAVNGSLMRDALQLSNIRRVNGGINTSNLIMFLYWSTSPYSLGEPYALYATSSYLGFSFTSRLYGLPVRCIKN